MKTITIRIPDDLDLDDQEAALYLAAKLYDSGKVSLGRAAEMANLTKEAFMKRLVKYDVPLIDYSVEELENEIERAGPYTR